MVLLDDVVKRFRGHVAVDHFSMSVPEGALFGFIGPNGSGKTTSLRMILRIIEPDSGRVEVLGKGHGGPANDAIGYLPEERGLYRKMTVLRQLVYFGRLKGLRSAEAKARALEWLERLDLTDWAEKKVETLSKGMSQKIQFISTVIANPPLLILDEPFSGLDPVNLEVLRSALLELRSKGTTVIFSTHDMHTAEHLCDHICMIYKGKKVLDGSMAEIQKTYGEDTIRLRFADTVDLAPDPLEGTRAVRHLGRFWEMQYAGEPSDILSQAMGRGKVDHFEVVHPSLHDIFVRLARPAEADLKAADEGEEQDD